MTDLFHKIRILNDRKHLKKESIPNASEEVDEASKEIKIGKGHPVDNVVFSKYVFHEEFFEEIKLYKKHEHTATEDQLGGFVYILTIIADEIANLVHALTKKAMDAGFHLSDFGHYKVNPEIRTQLQELIDLLEAKRGKAKHIANLCSAKAKISNSISNLLKKEEIGKDMLQLAKSFENVGSHAVAIKLYESIMNDFQSESSRLSSGLFPEISYIDSRPEREIEIFETANAAHQKLTAHDNREATPRTAKEEDSVPVIEPSEEEIENTPAKADNSFFALLKRLFKK